MLLEKPNRFHVGLLDIYVRGLMRRRFHTVQVDGFAGFDDWFFEKKNYPVVFYGFHRSWWDGFFVFRLGRRYRLDLRVMMEAANLKKYPYFQHVGAFGVDLQNTAGRAASLRHTVKYLRGEAARRAFLIYPHGRLVSPLEKEWPPFQPGLEAILRLCPQARAVPIVHEIIQGKQSRPDAYIELGQPIPGADKPTLTQLESALHQTFDTLSEKVLSDKPSKDFFRLR